MCPPSKGLENAHRQHRHRLPTQQGGDEKCGPHILSFSETNKQPALIAPQNDNTRYVQGGLIWDYCSNLKKIFMKLSKT